MFRNIYETNAWGNAESRSGPGSTVARGRSVGPALLQALAACEAVSLLDAPCGDFNWMKEFELPVAHYFGVDIVPGLCARNQQLYGDHQRQFLTLDITADHLPRADMIFCRDGLVHLSNADVWRALRQFRRSGADWLLTTTFSATRKNPDIATGHWRPLNLEIEPFCLPTPQARYSDGCPLPEHVDKELALWRLDRIPLHALRSQTQGVGDNRQ